MNFKSIRNALLLSPLMILLVACEGTYSGFMKFDEPNCSSGGTFVNIHYGDSQLRVRPVVKVKKGKALEFRLKPVAARGKEKGFEDAEVTIEAKDEEGKPVKNWLSKTPRGNSRKGSLIVCANTEEGMYHYSIHVAGLGTLDPRADVEP